MAYEFFPHTGDVGVRIRADSPERLFAHAAEAFADTITDVETVRASESARLELRAPELSLLLHDLLGELLFDFDTGRRLVASAEVALTQDDDGWVLCAITRGETLDESRHAIKVLIKGITYHALEVAERDGQWEATVVFDI